MTSLDPSLARPFVGVRVIEVGGTVAAAGATKPLADFGADVIKIEPLTGGDLRRLPPFPGDEPHLDRGAFHLALDTGKRSLPLDLATPSGLAILLELAAPAGAVVINLPPAEARPLLARIEALEGAPTVVVLTPHGLDGPFADNQEDEISVFARTTRMLRHSFTGQEPLRYAPQVPTMQWAATATAVLIAALWSARQGGPRRTIEVAATEALSGNVDTWYVGWAFSGVDLPRNPDSRLAYPNGYLPCSDGLLAFSAAGAPFFGRLCDAIGHPELATDPRFTNPLEKPNHYDEFMSILLPWLATRTRYEAFEELQAHGVMCAPLLDVAEAMTDPQTVARGSFVEVEQPAGVGVQTVAGPPYRFQGDANAAAWQLAPAPTFGQHTNEILADLGYSADERIALFRAGVTT